jgi:hypothetical protein
MNLTGARYGKIFPVVCVTLPSALRWRRLALTSETEVWFKLRKNIFVKTT